MKTEENMQQLKLFGMIRMWQSLKETRQHHGLNLEEGLDILLQAEKQDRDNRRKDRLEKVAGFRYQASIEEISFLAGRGIDKNMLLSLTDCQFIERGESLLITGPTGAGKSFIASAFGHQACQLGYKVAYYSLHKLFVKLRLFRADGSIVRFFDKLNRQQLLILDDFGLNRVDQQNRMDLMEIIEDRHNRKSTIIASQLPVATWYEIIGDDTIADAIMDRIIHGSHRIELTGESMRRKQ